METYNKIECKPVGASLQNQEMAFRSSKCVRAAVQSACGQPIAAYKRLGLMIPPAFH